MKLTKETLKQLIKEELEAVMSEESSEGSGMIEDFPGERHQGAREKFTMPFIKAATQAYRERGFKGGKLFAMKTHHYNPQYSIMIHFGGGQGGYALVHFDEDLGLYQYDQTTPDTGNDDIDKKIEAMQSKMRPVVAASRKG